MNLGEFGNDCSMSGYANFNIVITSANMTAEIVGTTKYANGIKQFKFLRKMFLSIISIFPSHKLEPNVV